MSDEALELGPHSAKWERLNRDGIPGGNSRAPPRKESVGAKAQYPSFCSKPRKCQTTSLLWEIVQDRLHPNVPNEGNVVRVPHNPLK